MDIDSNRLKQNVGRSHKIFRILGSGAMELAVLDMQINPSVQDTA